MTNYRRLVQLCTEMLDTYDPLNTSLEDHLNLYKQKCKGFDEGDVTFIVEVFSGCVRYDNVMRVVTNGFFVRDGKKSLRSQTNLYTVLCYLALFRLDELGVAHYRKFIRCQDVNKMYKFFNFFLDEKNLRTWMKDEWNKLYETGFVQTTLLSPILRWLPELQEIVQYLADKTENKIKPKKPEVKTTDVKPFNITQPRPRSVPMPQPIPKLKKHKQVPKTTYSQPTQENIMAEIREENRRLAEERLIESSRYQFACANPEKSDKVKVRVQKIIAEEEAKIDFEKHKANPLPSHVTQNVPIKLNTAAILREGRLFKKREDEQLKKLEDLESGAKDASDFLEWQDRMKTQDLEAELAAIERRRLEGQLSHEDAILARQNLIRENKEKVKEMKEEAREMMEEYLKQRLEEEKEMRRLVEDVIEGHENAKESKKKLQEYKAKIVQEVNKESQELMRQALEDAEEEMKRKIELITQIRAMEAVPVMRFKMVDLTSTPGYGYLGEMSIVELRERLALLKTKERDEEEERRDQILETKTNKDQLLMDTLTKISKHRAEQTKAAAEKMEIKKKTRLIKKPEHIAQDEKLQELQRRIEEKRQQRLEEQEKSKVLPNKKSQARLNTLVKEKKSSEARRWAELERTSQRTAQIQTNGMSKSAARFLQRDNSRLGVIYQES